VDSKFEKIRLLVLDFDGVMTDNRVVVSEDGTESVFCNRSDSLGIEMLKKDNREILVISKETNKVVLVRCQKLGIECVNSVDEKLTVFMEEINKRNLTKEEVCYVGNDVNDLDCVKEAGVGVAVSDSHPSLLDVADYITQKRGGEGAIREITDLILKEV